MLIRYLRRNGGEPWRTVKSAFATFINTRWQGSCKYKRGTLAIDEDLDGAFIPLTQAQKRLGIGIRRVKRLIAAGHLRHQRSGASLNAPTLVRREAIEVCSPNTGALLYCKDAAKRLGISYELARDFIEAGVLIPLAEPATAGGQRFLVSRLELDSLMQDVVDHSRSAHHASNKLISFREFLRKCASEKINRRAVINAMREGQVPAIVRTTKRLQLRQLKFDRDDVTNFIANNLINSGKRFVPTPVAASLLGFPKETVRWLAKNHHLRSHITPKGKYISIASIERIKRSYVQISTVARLHRTSPRVIWAALEQGNIRTLSGDGRTPIVLIKRSSVSNLRFAALIRSGHRKPSGVAGPKVGRSEAARR
jgi:hypothetical protein